MKIPVKFINVSLGNDLEKTNGMKYRITMMFPMGFLTKLFVRATGGKTKSGTVVFFNTEKQLRRYLSLFSERIHTLSILDTGVRKCYGIPSDTKLVSTTATSTQSVLISGGVRHLNFEILDWVTENEVVLDLISTEEELMKSMVVGDITAEEFQEIELLDIAVEKKKVEDLFKSVGRADLHVILSCRKVAHV